jgi:hypothetical protein
LKEELGKASVFPQLKSKLFVYYPGILFSQNPYGSIGINSLLFRITFCVAALERAAFGGCLSRS